MEISTKPILLEILSFAIFHFLFLFFIASEYRLFILFNGKSTFRISYKLNCLIF